MNLTYEQEEPLDEISMGESCYVDDQDVELDKLICRYVQKDNLKGITRRFALYDKIYLLQQKEASFKKVPEHRIDLTFLDPHPTAKLFISWKMLITGVVMLLLSVLMYVFDSQLHSLVDRQYVWSVTVLLASVGMIIVMVAYYRSYLTLVYHSDIGKVPLLVIGRKFRDDRYKKFIDIIGKCIHYARSRNGITLQDRLRGEMKDLRRLKDLGIVSEDDYDHAQKKILAQIK
mgnify:FL=1